MATKKIYNLAVKTGQYESGGEQKNRYLNIGSIMQKDDGGKFLIMSRTTNLAGVPNPENRDTVIVSMFKVKENDNQSPPPDQPDGNPFSDDDIPF